MTKLHKSSNVLILKMKLEFLKIFGDLLKTELWWRISEFRFVFNEPKYIGKWSYDRRYTPLFYFVCLCNQWNSLFYRFSDPILTDSNSESKITSNLESIFNPYLSPEFELIFKILDKIMSMSWKSRQKQRFFSFGYCFVYYVFVFSISKMTFEY